MGEEINFSQTISTANIKKSQQLLFSTYQFHLLQRYLLNNSPYASVYSLLVFSYSYMVVGFSFKPEPITKKLKPLTKNHKLRNISQ